MVCSRLMLEARRRRLVIVGAGLALVAAAAGGLFVGFAPDSRAICEDLFLLAGGPERAQREVTAAECEVAYAARLRERGRLGFAALGWCVRFAHTLEDAGRC